MNRQQRRAKQRAARNRQIGSIPEEGVLWQATGRYSKPDPTPPEVMVPGENCPPVLAYFNQMVEGNVWHDRKELDELITTIKKLSLEREYDGPMIKPIEENEVDESERWSWSRNWDCKYINIRFDMRDGAFVLTNSKDERICLEQLLWQYKYKKAES